MNEEAAPLPALRPNRVPRLLFVTPEAIFVPYRGSKFLYVGDASGNPNQYLAYLISDLFHSGADVHVVQPRYRRVFEQEREPEVQGTCSHLPADRVHLARDRLFYYAGEPDENNVIDNLRLSVTFQREVINRWIAEINPDLIHCHDWMSGLIPAACRTLGVTTLFSVGDLGTVLMPPGIDRRGGNRCRCLLGAALLLPHAGKL